MPDITDILSKGSAESDADGTERKPEGGENALEKMQKAKGEKEGDDKASLDSDELLKIMMTGENTDGMVSEVSSEDDKDKHAKAEGSPKVDGSKAESKGKYKDMFKTDMFKHPDKYFVMTPDGRMTIAEAMRRGYNPITRNFEESKSRDAIMREATKGLNDSDRETVNRMMDPRAAMVASDDAKGFGLDADSPMVKRPQQPEQPQVPQAPQGQPSSEQVVGGMAPGGESEATNPLAALLGGR